MSTGTPTHTLPLPFVWISIPPLRGFDLFDLLNNSVKGKPETGVHKDNKINKVTKIHNITENTNIRKLKL